MSNSLNSAFLSSLKDVCKESNLFETLLVGDFNLPDISWEHCNLKCVNSNSTNNKILLKQAEFMNLFNELGLNWYLVNETTRRRVVNGVLQESLLDHVLYTNEALVYDVKLLSRFGKSDHVSMKIELGVSLNKPKSNVKKEATKKLSWSRISSDEIMKYSLNNIDWNYSSDILNTEEMWSELHSKLSDIIDIVPVLRVGSNNRPLNVPWSNSDLKRMRKHKDSAWNEFQEIPTNERFSYAMSRDKIYSDKEFILKLNYENKLTNNLKNNSKGFYSYLRNKQQLKTGVQWRNVACWRPSAPTAPPFLTPLLHLKSKAKLNNLSYFRKHATKIYKNVCF